LVQRRARPSRDKALPFRAGLYLFLLKISNALKGKHSAFYMGLLREGFLGQGALTLVGLCGTRVLFKTVIQLDADITCQMDCRLLKDSNLEARIAGCCEIQGQLLEGFRDTLGSLVLGILAILSAFLAVLCLMWLP